MFQFKNLTKERAKMLYYDKYWLKNNINTLPLGIAEDVFYNGTNQGPERQIMYLQKILGVDVDGYVGNNTRKAAEEADIENVRKLLHIRRDKRYDEIIEKHPKNKVFEKGWKNR